MRDESDAGLLGQGRLGGIPDETWSTSRPGAGDEAEDLLSLRRMLLPGTALLLLGCVALFLSGRKGKSKGQLRVIESVALGPKRSLVIAQVGEEQLVLGCSEAGISLLASRPAPPEPQEPKKPANSTGRGDAGAQSRAVGRYAEVASTGAEPPSPFDELLAESAEDQELRRRLAEGLRGRVR